MEIKYKVKSVEQKWVIANISTYYIKGEAFASTIELKLSEEQYRALNKEVGPIQLGSEIPVTIPGTPEYDDE